MLGKRSQQRGLFEADTVYVDFVGKDTFYGWLASERGRLFRDEEFAALYCADNGRASVPPSLLATALVLQTYEGASDAEAKDRADYDVRWKVALGIELRGRPFAKSTLQVFRAQLVLHDGVRMMFERSLEKAREGGFLKRRKKLHVAVDTMAILGRGAVKDTYNLLADGIVKLLRALASESGEEEVQWASARGLGRYFGRSIKGSEEVDWDDEGARRRFLSGIVADADGLLEMARRERARCEEGGERDRRIVEASELLRQLLVQDVERREDGPAIGEGVAKDRVVSVHDPEMRHGHKSSTGRFDGHKGAVAVDADSQLITAVCVVAGNDYDGDTGLVLTEESEGNTGLEAAETVGDCAYGDGETRRQFREAGRALEAPVPGPPRAGRIPKERFRIGRGEDRVSCPGGVTTRQWRWRKLRANRSGRRYRVRVFRFPSDRCSACPLKAGCVGERAGPRTITLHPHQKEMDRARRHQRTQAHRKARKRRQAVEHRIARLRQLGVKQARYAGRAKTLFQLLMAATVANLTLVAGAARAGAVILCRIGGRLRSGMALMRPSGRLRSPVRTGPGLSAIATARAGVLILTPQNRPFRPRF